MFTETHRMIDTAGWVSVNGMGWSGRLFIVDVRTGQTVAEAATQAEADRKIADLRDAAELEARIAAELARIN